MKARSTIILISFILLFVNVKAQYPEIETELDKKVKTFLDENANNWRDMNVPLSDGKILYDIIIKNNYEKAVEIGTSTGHSAVWMAWALSKTGGKLITIEIDKQRYLEAKANFKKAGVSEFIDARLADAHQLVPELPGKYDFVFSDADKYWYKNYFIAMDPKLEPGSCFTAHNTAMRTRGISEFLDYIESLKNYKTSIDRNSRSGISISYKISN
ncbi:MAG: methyltransferase [Prolixibacteraceae bacterium]|jgi:caffeoyl-CoA O-methyltransferase|nr:methyltransferase [Prolixibacteraceae bacterium]MBT6004332.1 methyltransferase [Prolixibacteraceae bacterium]MBT6764824.1 methyltransferase [Prolixibacteraceae bacterium]MBT6998383.1 methyltransferase [Prolixibacteraceae bacterium]MBT7397388.1 methyltransferase [Prolixibacteraceae bacterium]